MNPILILQHHEIETPGVFGEIVAERGLPTEVVRADLGEPLPADPRAFAALIVMGGPMGVYEEERYPWLRREDALLKAALARDWPVLGVCLGSQLIAKAAGARVAPGPEKEIGWYEIRLAPAAEGDRLFAHLPAVFEALEWHGDIFDLPSGAVSLARSARYPHQAFRLGRRAYGLLFHLEVTAAMVRRMTDTFRDELLALGDPRRVDTIIADSERCAGAINRHARGLFQSFLTLIE